MLRPRLRKLNENNLVFGTTSNKEYAKQNIEQTLRRTLVRTGLDMKYESTGRFLINTHSFRAYGITKLSRHDPNFAKRLAGQKYYLMEYDRLNSDAEKLELYKKYEIDLIVDNTAKLKAGNKKLEKEKNELKQIKVEKTKQKEQIDRLAKKITEMKTLEEKVNDLENFKEEMRREFMGEIKNLEQT